MQDIYYYYSCKVKDVLYNNSICFINYSWIFDNSIIIYCNVYNVRGCVFNLEWGSDDFFLYYIRADDNNRLYIVLRYKICQSILFDVVLYEEEDERYVQRVIIFILYLKCI